MAVSNLLLIKLIDFRIPVEEILPALCDFLFAGGGNYGNLTDTGINCAALVT